MTRTKNTIRASVAIMFCASALATACSSSDAEPIVCNLSHISDCVAPCDKAEEQKGLSAASYHWISSGKMEVTMTNVSLPCQSGVFESEAKIDNSRIEITTKPEGGNSSCKCFKNYRIEVGGIPQGDYMVVIDGRELGMVRIY